MTHLNLAHFFHFTRENTTLLKGVAIILIVVKHAVGYEPWWARLLGFQGVSLFIILSGLGLILSRKDHLSPLEFYLNRSAKIFPLYWFVVLSSYMLIKFFPGSLYTTNTYNVTVHHLPFFLTATHVFYQQLYESFNITWWFISLILQLYLLFPLLTQICRRLGTYLTMALSFALWFGYQYFILPENSTFFLNHASALLFLPLFLFGMYLATLHQITTVDTLVVKRLLLLLITGLLTFLAYLPSAETVQTNLIHQPHAIIGIAVFLIIQFLIIFSPFRLVWLSRVVALFGRYSYEIFLTHMFVLVPLRDTLTPYPKILAVVMMLTISLLLGYLTRLIFQIFTRLIYGTATNRYTAY